ncbi:hypothetical protein PAPYR_13093 [Paratrimastix pyriformis]|uniref:Uncharacterized protein n=1 Tax=Paratrimastix pyriformis TaxID=342808 RepID=A0ABQ8U388_9EUKA|nr:hypothetical protein PAPYR_13093 [Paratrimastix pyriformis]
MNTEVFRRQTRPCALRTRRMRRRNLWNNMIQTRPASFPPAPLESEPSGTASTCTEIAHALAQSASSETISAHGCDVHSRMNSPVAAPRHAARCPDRGSARAGCNSLGPQTTFKMTRRRPLARATDRGAEVEPLVGSCGRQPGETCGLGPVVGCPRSARAAPTCCLPGQGGLVREEPSDSTKKTLVPALARALEGSPGDVTLELVIRWACPGGAAPETRAHLQELLASQAPAERHMTTPPQTPAWQRPGGASSVSAGLLWSSPTPPGDARVASSAFAEPSACTSSQARGCGISATAAPFASPQLFRDSAVPGAAEPLPAAGRMVWCLPPPNCRAFPAACCARSGCCACSARCARCADRCADRGADRCACALLAPRAAPPLWPGALLLCRPLVLHLRLLQGPRRSLSANLRVAARAGRASCEGAPSPVELVIGQVLGLVSGLRSLDATCRG